jgi:hypothetical protein
MMDFNPYYLAMNPMGNPRPQTQDLGGLAPVYQNIANQQAMQNMAMQQAQGLTQQAGQTAQGGMNPMAMAMALRKGQKSDPYANAQEAMKKYGAENVYGFGGQGTVPTQITGQDQYEPIKNMPSVGAYGQLIPSN